MKAGVTEEARLSGSGILKLRLESLNFMSSAQSCIACFTHNSISPMALDHYGTPSLSFLLRFEIKHYDACHVKSVPSAGTAPISPSGPVSTTIVIMESIGPET